jgi:hypothetical protein
MNENKIQSPNHAAIRRVLCIGGPLIALAGLVFIIVGVASFFTAFGAGGPPSNFWCLFVGIPLLFVGAVMCQMGFLGAFARYVAGEAAPVAKDVVNYMGENTQPGVKAVAKAITEGVIEASKERENKQDGK